MRRSAALAPLSRDHHHALVITAALSRASNATASSSATLFADFIDEHEQRHFTIEESLLLPTLPRQSEAASSPSACRQTTATRVKRHDGSGSPTHSRRAGFVHSTGARPGAHVRLEEREQFPSLVRYGSRMSGR